MTVTRRTALLAGLATLAGCSTAGYQGPEREVVIAAGESGGFYLAFAELLAQQLNRAEPRLHATAVATEASVENLRRLRDGRADLGLVLGDVAESALAGAAPFSVPIAFSAIGRVYENYHQLVVRADVGVRSLSDLAGRPVAMGANGSGVAVFSTRLFARAEIPVHAKNLLLGEAINALVAHEVDALFWSGGIPTPALTELNRTTPITLLPLDTHLPALRAGYGPVYDQVHVPAQAYQGVGELRTIGVANLLLAAPSLPEDAAAAVARVLAGHAADLVPAPAVGTQFLDVRTLIGTGQVPLHPGAASAYRALHG
ncbi:TAXI family TRAP transporter solute-binding subunit [Amycolatopsis oliviviridis]|uniref:C4-dicarboxylate ABC transporter substrate-binding protein n=1 Tax=Amycolatopsis oliviviridis TaxID=1471590 RepID=A0ABQ3L4F0_9PSEU|nr:TAXI family TRAP transporter solute-binding subunit [Amycolatopsis oliviviridis]GHH03899.1 C4-dicarboxylate ABC transporter substrate-binding protein [Amycolatopsis oliviviridis]